MKKSLFITIALFAVSLTSFSQEITNKTNKEETFNEIKLNGLFLVLGAFEVTYERTLNEESGAGVSIFFPVSEDVESVNFYISPYYRFYFGKNYASGFFVEGFGMLNSTETYNYDYNYATSESTETYRDVTDFALGFGIGGKWITKKGFMVEVFSGVGRNLFNSKDADYEIIGKGGVNIGIRF